jgi:protein TonB
VNLGWPVAGSVAFHAAGVTLASALIAFAPASEVPPAVPIDVVRVEASPAPPPPPPPPRKAQPKPKLVPPKLAVKPQDVEIPTTPVAPAPLMDDLRPRRTTLPSSSDSFAGSSAPALGASAGPVFDAAGGPRQALAGARTYAGKGDVLLPTGGGNGGSGPGTRNVAAIPQESADGAGGLTDFARPLGGYQTKPSYPESARRQGIEGVTTLRFQVLTSGQVGSVSIAHSAGSTALDRAAVEAVRTWLFEPARRGKEVVAVWVTLPVRFHLQGE